MISVKNPILLFFLVQSLLISIVNISGAQKLQFSGSDKSISILPHFVGYNNQMASRNEPWNDAGTLYSLEKSAVGLLRYPGGTVSNYWDMENDRLFQNGEEIDTTDASPRKWLKTENVIGWVVPMWPARNSLNNLQRAHQTMELTESKPAIIFVLNMITPGADYYALKWNRQIDETPYSNDWWAMMNDRLTRNISMLDKAVENGILVEYIEFGNEYYFGKSYAGTGANGGAKVEPYSAGAVNTSLTGAFPGDGKAYADAVNHWADSLVKRYPGSRLCAIGAIANGEKPSRRNSWNEKVAKHIDSSLVPAVSLHVYGGVENGNLSTTEENLGMAFASWTAYWKWIKKYSSLPFNREFWFTEYNSNADKKTWGHGLLNLHTISTWLKEGNLGLTNYHQFAQNTYNGFNLFASARVLSFLAEASRGNTLAQNLIIPGNVSLKGTETFPAVSAWRFITEEENEYNYFVVNYSSEPLEFDFSNLEMSEDTRYKIAQAPLSAVIDPGVQTGFLNQLTILPATSCLIFRAGEIISPPSLSVDSKMKQEISIYPNPSQGRFHLKISNPGLLDRKFQFKATNFSGEEVLEITATPGEIEDTMNKIMNKLPNGFYLMHFTGQKNNQAQTLKWIKNY